MRRREYVPLVAATALPLAGCSGTGVDGNPGDEGSDPSGGNETDSGNNETDAEPAYEIRSVNAPEQVASSDPVSVSVTIANTGEAGGTYTGTVRFDSEGEGTVSLTTTRDIEIDVLAGETATWEQDVEFDGWGYVTLSVDDREQEITLAPENQAPRIKRLSLVDEWEEFGDVEENAVFSISAGETGLLGIRYEYWHANGTLDVTFEATIEDNDGIQVEVLRDSSDRLTDRQGWGEWEGALAFRSEAIGPGEYEAEVYVRNDQTDEVSEPETTFFEIE